MISVHEWVTALSALLMVGAAVVTVWRVRDALLGFEKALDRIDKTLQNHGDRLTKIETAHDLMMERHNRHESQYPG